VEIMHLIDTNIFLEVLLSQEKKDVCKKILDANIGNQYLSDFSLHSIGVILFKMDKDFNRVRDKIKITFVEHIV
jgi:hypothetical protein